MFCCDQLTEAVDLEAFYYGANPRIDDDDLGAIGRHQLGDLGADPARRPGADCNPSLEHTHRAALCRLMPHS